MTKPVELLLVEDNPGDVELIKESLAGGRIANRLHVVEDGTEALSFLRNEGKYADREAIDLVLLDINLPKKNGHEVLQTIREDPKLKSLPVVILTTSDQDRDILKAYEQQVNAYVTKPVNVSDFIDAVKSIEDFWLTLVKLPSRN